MLPVPEEEERGVPFGEGRVGSGEAFSTRELALARKGVGEICMIN